MTNQPAKEHKIVIVPKNHNNANNHGQDFFLPLLQDKGLTILIVS